MEQRVRWLENRVRRFIGEGSYTGRDIAAHIIQQRTVWLPFIAGRGVTFPAEDWPGVYLADAAFNNAQASWLVPSDFNAVSSLTIYIHSKGTGNYRRKIAVNASVAGEDTDALTTVNDWAQVAVTAEKLTELTATVANLPAMASGDIFTLWVQRDGVDANDTVGAAVYAIGAKLVYTAVGG
uniref:Uncharacterized protein n=1 Tax=viral metagenome TaxID=1070528 RepID=A0A6H1ZNQ7_9ZZZZ